jgi:D-3-phosphoglycerate dehydrogenase
MKPGAMFINTARGEDRRSAVKGGIRAGLDVFPGEPAGGTGDFVTPLAALPGVYGTHHIGGSTDQAQEAIAAETVRVITAYMTTGKVPNVVNLAKVSPASHMLVVRHCDRPGVLAHVFDQLRQAASTSRDREHHLRGAEAAVARINLDGEPAASVIAALRAGNGDILDVRVVPL